MTYPFVRSFLAAYDPERRQRRPEIGLDSTSIGGRSVPVHERTVLEQPFCRLLHIARETRCQDPRLLVIAPLSGHFSALLHDLLAALLPEHDLYLIDWRDARDVPVCEGRFALEENIAHVMICARAIGGAFHMLALCQSALPALAATALLADLDAIRPRSLILISGMLDTRINPTALDRVLAKPRDWLVHEAKAIVPAPHPGRGRAVFPARVRHAALLAYLARQIATSGELFGDLLNESGLDGRGHPFLELYLSVMDLPAEFVSDMVHKSFQDFSLPRGRLTWRGAKVDPSAIHATGLMTVEGALDDISSPGQTSVAHALCRNIPDRRRVHHVQGDAGHFGTFYGPIWRSRIMPLVRDFIRSQIVAHD
jgi:poly(3-hydroxybutyrate) depolymerase